MEKSARSTQSAQESLVKFNLDNFTKGFLLDDELMGGISLTENGEFNVYILRHATGEVLGSQTFPTASEAIRTMNQVDRPWSFEAINKCGDCGPNGGGSCQGKGCKKLQTKT